MTNSDEVKLLPCRACGEKCRVERFEGDQIDGVMTIYMCANSTKFGGICPDPHAYLNVNAWNTRPPVVTDEVVERVALDQAQFGELLIEFIADQFDDGSR